MRASSKIIGSKSSSGIVTDGLVLYLDPASSISYSGSGVTWNDLSGSSRNATLAGNPTYSSSNGGVFNFDRVDDHATLSAPLAAGQQKYTLSAWWNTNNNSSFIQSVFEQNSSTLTQNRRAAILLVFGSWGFNGESNDAHDKVPVRLNTWVYGAITVDTTLATNPIKIYENGSLYWQGNSANASLLNMGNAGATVGKKYVNSSEYFGGSIGPVMIYNRVLSSTEISQNFNTIRTRYGI